MKYLFKNKFWINIFHKWRKFWSHLQRLADATFTLQNLVSDFCQECLVDTLSLWLQFVQIANYLQSSRFEDGVTHRRIIDCDLSQQDLNFILIASHLG
jgi:hypothetical protein